MAAMTPEVCCDHVTKMDGSKNAEVCFDEKANGREKVVLLMQRKLKSKE